MTIRSSYIQVSLTHYPLLSFLAMKAAFITAFFALFVSFVVAQSSTPFYVTSPIVGTSYKAGST